MPPKKFDLNMEDVLEDWGVAQAVREVIANALDEQVLTKTDLVRIQEDKERRWHIKDFGRGVRIAHLTQKENPEKLAQPDKVIGKFGIGVKDALATFARHDVGVRIMSRHGDITIGMAPKHGFPDISTLHAILAPPSHPRMVGTEVILAGVTTTQMDEAQRYFLRRSNEEVLATTPYGQILANQGTARIYITGLRLAQEDNFLFSYNITATSKAIKSQLNRERTNVGRSAYSERVKAILLACNDPAVAKLLVRDLKHFHTGALHDELGWVEVALHACKLLNQTEPVLFVTPQDLLHARDLIEHAQHDGYTIITVPDNVKAKLRGAKDYAGNPIRELVQYAKEWDTSFKFMFIPENKLTPAERKIFRTMPALFALIGGRPGGVQDVLISKTMRMETYRYQEAVGVWEPKHQRIIIKRTQLKNLQTFASTLLHEVAHARSNATDLTASFEQELTNLLGTVASKGV